MNDELDFEEFEFEIKKRPMLFKIIKNTWNINIHEKIVWFRFLSNQLNREQVISESLNGILCDQESRISLIIWPNFGGFHWNLNLPRNGLAVMNQEIIKLPFNSSCIFHQRIICRAVYNEKHYKCLRLQQLYLFIFIFPKNCIVTR